MGTREGPSIRVSSVSTGLEELRATVAAFEASYGCSSEVMLQKVLGGKIYETAEIGKWLSSYHVLKRLEEQYGLLVL